MAMGWIGGVVAANAICSRMEQERINKHKGYDDYPKHSVATDVQRYIEMMMTEEGCQTLEEKRMFLIRFQYCNLEFPNKDWNECLKFIIPDMLRDIEFKLSVQKENEYYSKKPNMFIL